MFVAVVLLFLWCQSSAEVDKVSYRCTDRTFNKSLTTFTPAADGVPGRYKVELCTANNPIVWQWTVDVSTYDDSSYCDGLSRLRRPDHLHSNNILNITDPPNCANICYSTNFDLIFTACYGIKSTFKLGSITGPPHDSFHMIKNNITKDHILLNMPYVNVVNHDDDVSLYWYLGIPPTGYKVYIYTIENNTLVEPEHKLEVTQNCSSTLSSPEVQCSLAPAHACYRALLLLDAPWTAGIFYKKTYVRFDFCHLQAVSPQVGVSAARVWWSLGGALCVAALLAVLLLRRALFNNALHKQVLASWTNREVEPPASGSVSPRAGVVDRRPVLLVYAREGELAQQAVDALKALIQQTSGGQVWDIMSPEVMSMCASAPAQWVRDMVSRSDVRVLVLQTPATAALYSAHLNNQPSPTLVSPLLGGRAMYRAPVFGDTLVQLALRLISENVATHNHYHKYYLATYSALQTESFPQVVPYRRYVLPAAARVLALDVCGAPPPRHTLRRYTCAARTHTLHATQHPDYLMDELIIV